MKIEHFKSCCERGILKTKTLAEELGVSQRAVQNWFKRGIPAEQLKKLPHLINKHHLAIFGKPCIDNEYHVVPVEFNDKVCSLEGRQNVIATYDDIDKWLKVQHYKKKYNELKSGKVIKANIGDLKYGSIGFNTKYNPAIDIDVHDEKVVNMIVEAITPELDDGVIMYRTGLAPKILIPCRNDEPYGIIHGTKFYDNIGVKHHIEILADGQYYVAFGIHPETDENFKWKSDSPLNVKLSELPLLTKELAQKIITAADEIIRDNTDWTTNKPTDESKKKSTSVVPENYSGDLIVGMSAELKHKYTLRRYQLENLEHIHSGIDYREWHYVLMALHKEGEGRAEFYQIGRNWSMSAGTGKGYFDKEAQKELPPEMEKSSKWKSFKGAKEGKRDIDGSYIQYLFDKHCPYSEYQRVISGFDVIEFTPSI